MKNEQPPKLNRSSTETERRKLPYSSPQFHVYGSVSKLTSGGGGTMTDGGGAACHIHPQID